MLASLGHTRLLYSCHNQDSLSHSDAFMYMPARDRQLQDRDTASLPLLPGAPKYSYQPPLVSFTLRTAWEEALISDTIARTALPSCLVLLKELICIAGIVSENMGLPRASVAF